MFQLSRTLSVAATGSAAWSTPTRLAPTLQSSVPRTFPLPTEPPSVYSASQIGVGRGGGTLALWWNPRFPSTLSAAVRPAAAAAWDEATEVSSTGLDQRRAPVVDVDAAGTASVLAATDTSVEVRTTDVGGDVMPPPPTPRARISTVLIPFVKTCPATAAVNVSGTKATLPITPSGSGAALRCRVSGSVALPSTTRVGTLLVAVVSAKGVLPSTRVVRATA